MVRTRHFSLLVGLSSIPGWGTKVLPKKKSFKKTQKDILFANQINKTKWWKLPSVERAEGTRDETHHGETCTAFPMQQQLHQNSKPA